MKKYFDLIFLKVNHNWIDFNKKMPPTDNQYTPFWVLAKNEYGYSVIQAFFDQGGFKTSSTFGHCIENVIMYQLIETPALPKYLP